MNTFIYCCLMITVSFGLGMVVGESWAPISGATVQALSARTSTLEQHLDDLKVKYEALATRVKESCFNDGGF